MEPKKEFWKDIPELSFFLNHCVARSMASSFNEKQKPPDPRSRETTKNPPEYFENALCPQSPNLFRPPLFSITKYNEILNDRYNILVIKYSTKSNQVNKTKAVSQQTTAENSFMYISSHFGLLSLGPIIECLQRIPGNESLIPSVCSILDSLLTDVPPCFFASSLVSSQGDAASLEAISQLFRNLCLSVGSKNITMLLSSSLALAISTGSLENVLHVLLYILQHTNERILLQVNPCLVALSQMNNLPTKTSSAESKSSESSSQKKYPSEFKLWHHPPLVVDSRLSHTNHGSNANKQTLLTRENACVNVQVSRGPDWCWDDRDGFGTGKIIHVDNNWVRVLWENGASGRYRCGDHHDLVLNQCHPNPPSTPHRSFSANFQDSSSSKSARDVKPACTIATNSSFVFFAVAQYPYITCFRVGTGRNMTVKSLVYSWNAVTVHAETQPVQNSDQKLSFGNSSVPQEGFSALSIIEGSRQPFLAWCDAGLFLNDTGFCRGTVIRLNPQTLQKEAEFSLGVEQTDESSQEGLHHFVAPGLSESFGTPPKNRGLLGFCGSQLKLYALYAAQNRFEVDIYHCSLENLQVEKTITLAAQGNDPISATLANLVESDGLIFYCTPNCLCLEHEPTHFFAGFHLDSGHYLSGVEQLSKLPQSVPSLQSVSKGKFGSMNSSSETYMESSSIHNKEAACFDPQVNLLLRYSPIKNQVQEWVWTSRNGEHNQVNLVGMSSELFEPLAQDGTHAEISQPQLVVNDFMQGEQLLMLVIKKISYLRNSDCFSIAKRRAEILSMIADAILLCMDKISRLEATLQDQANQSGIQAPLATYSDILCTLLRILDSLITEHYPNTFGPFDANLECVLNKLKSSIFTLAWNESEILVQNQDKLQVVALNLICHSFNSLYPTQTERFDVLKRLLRVESHSRPSDPKFHSQKRIWTAADQMLNAISKNPSIILPSSSSVDGKGLSALLDVLLVTASLEFEALLKRSSFEEFQISPSISLAIMLQQEIIKPLLARANVDPNSSIDAVCDSRVTSLEIVPFMDYFSALLRHCSQLVATTIDFVSQNECDLCLIEAMLLSSAVGSMLPIFALVIAQSSVTTQSAFITGFISRSQIVVDLCFQLSQLESKLGYENCTLLHQECGDVDEQHKSKKEDQTRSPLLASFMPKIVGVPTSWLSDIVAMLATSSGRVIAALLDPSHLVMSPSEIAIKPWLESELLSGGLGLHSQSCSIAAQIRAMGFPSDDELDALHEWMSKRTPGKPILSEAMAQGISKAERACLTAMLAFANLGSVATSAASLIKSALEEGHEQDLESFSHSSPVFSSLRPVWVKLWSIDSHIIRLGQLQKEWQFAVEAAIENSKTSQFVEAAISAAQVFVDYDAIKLQLLCSLKGVGYNMLEKDAHKNAVQRLVEVLTQQISEHIESKESSFTEEEKSSYHPQPENPYFIVSLDVIKRAEFLLSLAPPLCFSNGMETTSPKSMHDTNSPSNSSQNDLSSTSMPWVKIPLIRSGTECNLSSNSSTQVSDFHESLIKQSHGSNKSKKQDFSRSVVETSESPSFSVQKRTISTLRAFQRWRSWRNMGRCRSGSGNSMALEDSDTLEMSLNESKTHLQSSNIPSDENWGEDLPLLPQVSSFLISNVSCEEISKLILMRESRALSILSAFHHWSEILVRIPYFSCVLPLLYHAKHTRLSLQPISDLDIRGCGMELTTRVQQELVSVLWSIVNITCEGVRRIISPLSRIVEKESKEEENLDSKETTHENPKAKYENIECDQAKKVSDFRKSIAVQSVALTLQHINMLCTKEELARDVFRYTELLDSFQLLLSERKSSDPDIVNLRVDALDSLFSLGIPCIKLHSDSPTLPGFDNLSKRICLSPGAKRLAQLQKSIMDVLFEEFCVDFSEYVQLARKTNEKSTSTLIGIAGCKQAEESKNGFDLNRDINFREASCYRLLDLLYRTKDTATGHTCFTKPIVVKTLLSVIMCGSNRLQRLSANLLRFVLPLHRGIDMQQIVQDLSQSLLSEFEVQDAHLEGQLRRWSNGMTRGDGIIEFLSFLCGSNTLSTFNLIHSESFSADINSSKTDSDCKNDASPRASRNTQGKYETHYRDEVDVPNIASRYLVLVLCIPQMLHNSLRGNLVDSLISRLSQTTCFDRILKQEKYPEKYLECLKHTLLTNRQAVLCRGENARECVAELLSVQLPIKLCVDRELESIFDTRAQKEDMHQINSLYGITTAYSCTTDIVMLLRHVISCSSQWSHFVVNSLVDILHHSFLTKKISLETITEMHQNGILDRCIGALQVLGAFRPVLHNGAVVRARSPSGSSIPGTVVQVQDFSPTCVVKVSTHEFHGVHFSYFDLQNLQHNESNTQYEKNSMFMDLPIHECSLDEEIPFTQLAIDEDQAKDIACLLGKVLSSLEQLTKESEYMDLCYQDGEDTKSDGNPTDLEGKTEESNSNALELLSCTFDARISVLPLLKSHVAKSLAQIVSISKSARVACAKDLSIVSAILQCSHTQNLTLSGSMKSFQIDRIATEEMMSMALAVILSTYSIQSSYITQEKSNGRWIFNSSQGPIFYADESEKCVIYGSPGNSGGMNFDKSNGFLSASPSKGIFVISNQVVSYQDNTFAYFEVTVIHTQESNFSIGFTSSSASIESKSSTKESNSHASIGRASHSTWLSSWYQPYIALDFSDNRIWSCSAGKHTCYGKIETAICIGDVVGCKITSECVEFFINGCGISPKVPSQLVFGVAHEALPAIGLNSPGVCLNGNFGERPFYKSTSNSLTSVSTKSIGSTPSFGKLTFHLHSNSPKAPAKSLFKSKPRFTPEFKSKPQSNSESKSGFSFSKRSFESASSGASFGMKFPSTSKPGLPLKCEFGTKLPQFNVGKSTSLQSSEKQNMEKKSFPASQSQKPSFGNRLPTKFEKAFKLSGNSASPKKVKTPYGDGEIKRIRNDDMCEVRFSWGIAYMHTSTLQNYDSFLNRSTNLNTGCRLSTPFGEGVVVNDRGDGIVEVDLPFSAKGYLNRNCVSPKDTGSFSIGSKGFCMSAEKSTRSRSLSPFGKTGSRVKSPSKFNPGSFKPTLSNTTNAPFSLTPPSFTVTSPTSSFAFGSSDKKTNSESVLTPRVSSPWSMKPASPTISATKLFLGKTFSLKDTEAFVIDASTQDEKWYNQIERSLRAASVDRNTITMLLTQLRDGGDSRMMAELMISDVISLPPKPETVSESTNFVKKVDSLTVCIGIPVRFPVDFLSFNPSDKRFLQKYSSIREKQATQQNLPSPQFRSRLFGGSISQSAGTNENVRGVHVSNIRIVEPAAENFDSVFDGGACKSHAFGVVIGINSLRTCALVKVVEQDKGLEHKIWCPLDVLEHVESISFHATQDCNQRDSISAHLDRPCDIDLLLHGTLTTVGSDMMSCLLDDSMHSLTAHAFQTLLEAWIEKETHLSSCYARAAAVSILLEESECSFSDYQAIYNQMKQTSIAREEGEGEEGEEGEEGGGDLEQKNGNTDALSHQTNDIADNSSLLFAVSSAQSRVNGWKASKNINILKLANLHKFGIFPSLAGYIERLVAQSADYASDACIKWVYQPSDGLNSSVKKIVFPKAACCIIAFESDASIPSDVTVSIFADSRCTTLLQTWHSSYGFSPLCLSCSVVWVQVKLCSKSIWDSPLAYNRTSQNVRFALRIVPVHAAFLESIQLTNQLLEYGDIETLSLLCEHALPKILDFGMTNACPPFLGEAALSMASSIISTVTNPIAMHAKVLDLNSMVPNWSPLLRRLLFVIEKLKQVEESSSSHPSSDNLLWSPFLTTAVECLSVALSHTGSSNVSVIHLCGLLDLFEPPKEIVLPKIAASRGQAKLFRQDSSYRHSRRHNSSSSFNSNTSSDCIVADDGPLSFEENRWQYIQQLKKNTDSSVGDKNQESGVEPSATKCEADNDIEEPLQSEEVPLWISQTTLIVALLDHCIHGQHACPLPWTITDSLLAQTLVELCEIGDEGLDFQPSCLVDDWSLELDEALTWMVNECARECGMRCRDVTWTHIQERMDTGKVVLSRHLQNTLKEKSIACVGRLLLVRILNDFLHVVLPLLRLHTPNRMNCGILCIDIPKRASVALDNPESKEEMSLQESKDTTDGVYVLPVTLASRLSHARNLLFRDVRIDFCELLLDSTSYQTVKPKIKVDRLRIAAAKEGKGVETTNVQPQDIDKGSPATLFDVIFEQLDSLHPALLRPCKPQGSEPHVAFNIEFLGERVLGDSGPYRQVFTDLGRELQGEDAGALNMLIQCPNGQESVGDNRDKYLPTPHERSFAALTKYRFLGKLLGIAMRTHTVIAIDLPGLCWKRLVGQCVDRSDLEAIDQNVCAGVLNLLSTCGFDEFVELPPLHFTITLSDHTELELHPGGSKRVVTWENRLEYIKLAEQVRLQESEQQIRSIFSGLQQVIPLEMLTLCSWEDLSHMVAGTPQVDLPMLRRHTEYGGYSSDSPQVLYFWQCMDSFSDKERRLFLRFAWGQERLPRTDEDFDRHPRTRLLIKKRIVAGDPDKAYPRADTCFFNVELPEYSTFETMHKMLLFAIHMDADSMDADTIESNPTQENARSFSSRPTIQR